MLEEDIYYHIIEMWQGNLLDSLKIKPVCQSCAIC